MNVVPDEARRGCWNPLGLELQEVMSHLMWVLGTELMSSAKKKKKKKKQCKPLSTEPSPPHVFEIGFLFEPGVHAGLHRILLSPLLPTPHNAGAPGTCCHTQPLTWVLGDPNSAPQASITSI